jgi:hypothetical protein
MIALALNTLSFAGMFSSRSSAATDGPWDDIVEVELIEQSPLIPILSPPLRISTSGVSP